MQTITVNRNDLLARIRKNRDDHHALFVKAQEGFRARAIEELDDMMKHAQSGEVRLYVGLEPPQDHTAEYDRAIDMLEMEVAEQVQISRVDFAQLVRNEWAWFHSATVTNTLYASGGKMGGSHA